MRRTKAEEQLRQETSGSPKRSLTEGTDYYLENGCFVFTAKFLKERGYCCKSGCRHCPYGFQRTG
ncbi:MAG: hypothetical protein RI973_492 [Bacteroidota bacterium]|jgi:hypothetical protein